MELLSLTVTNYRVIRSARVLLGRQVTGITGPNGAGKSTLVEAVAWALYGNPVARSGKDEIPNAQAGAGCEVELTFALGSEHYRVVRRLVGKSQRPEVLLFCGTGHGAAHEAVGSTEVGQRLVELLGLDWRGFTTSFLARQQELNALAEFQPAQRREQLAAMLGVQRLDKAMQRVRDDARRAADRAGVLEGQTGRRDALEGTVGELGEHVQALQLQQDSTKGALADTKQRLDEISKRCREHEAKQAECSRIEAERGTISATLAQLTDQRETLQKQEHELRGVAAELDQSAPRLGPLPALRKQLEEMQQAREQSTLRERWRREITDLDREQAVVERRLSESRTGLDDLIKQRGRIADDIVERQAGAMAALESARDEFAEVDGDLRAARQEVARIQGQVQSMNDIGPEAVCDRCHRPFGDDLDGIREHLEEELRQKQTELAACQTEVDRRRKQGVELRREADRLADEIRVAGDLDVRIGAIREALSELQQRLERVGKRREVVVGDLAKISTVEFDPDELSRVSAKVADLETLGHRVSELRGRLKQRDQVTRSLAELADKISRAEQQQHAATLRLEALGFDRAGFDKLRAKLSTCQEELESARTSAAEAAKELELTERELSFKREELTRLKGTQAEAVRLRDDQYYRETLASLMAGFRKHTVNRIRPRLSELAGEILSEASGGRYGLLELDDDYNIQVMDDGRLYGVDRFSGGEKDLASLCLRLAISLALTESAGLERSFVILDEVFGSQDSGRRETIFESLAHLRARFPQMILITHLEELRDKVESLIEVIPKAAGYSEVVVDGEKV